MPRIRGVKPEFFQHEQLVQAEIDHKLPHLMLVYVGLWTQCDRRGLFRWAPRTLQLNVLPHRPPRTFDRCLTLLAELGFLVRYTVDGRDFGWVPTFLRHQYVNHRERADPNIPDVPQDVKARWAVAGVATIIDQLEPQTGPIPAPYQPHTDPVPTRGQSRGDRMGIGDGDKDGGSGRAGARDAEPPPPGTPDTKPAEAGPEDPPEAFLAPFLISAIGDKPDLCAKALRELLSEGLNPGFLTECISTTKGPVGVWAWTKATRAAWKARKPTCVTTTNQERIQSRRSALAWADRARESARGGDLKKARGAWAQALTFAGEASIDPADLGAPPDMAADPKAESAA